MFCHYLDQALIRFAVSELEGLEKLTSADLEADIPMWRGTRQRKVGVYAYIGELINHKGQIVMLRGNIKRRREQDPGFLK